MSSRWVLLLCGSAAQVVRRARSIAHSVLPVIMVLGLVPAHAAAPIPSGPTTLEGTLEVLIEDHGKFSRTRHFLKSASGRIELGFAGRPLLLRSGTKLTARGVRSGNTLALSSGDSAALNVTASAPPSNTMGEHKVAVLLVNFSDDRRQPYTLAHAADVVFGQVNGFIRENSFQRTWLSGVTHGWLELPIAKTCDGGLIANHARQAAAGAGVDLTPYPRIVYVFPENSVCGWGGMANLGGSSPAIWINGWLTLSVTGHEFGHTFGLHHAHSMDCGASTLGPSGCTTWEYGDTVDMMGNRTAGHFDAFKKEQLGWLNNGTQPPIVTAQSSGRYTIEAYAAAPTGLPKAIKIPRGVDPLTGATRWYYLEYRQPTGYDAVLSSQIGSNLLSGLLIRSGTDGNGNSGVWLDATPSSSSWDDWADAALGFGQSYADAGAGLQIVAVSGDGRTAQVDISLGSTTLCVRAAPQLTLANASLSATAAGTPISYALTIGNKDSTGCGVTAFDLTAVVPNGWSSSFASPRITLGPSGNASTSWTVTPSAATSAGSYSLNLRATNLSELQHVGTAVASYTLGAAISTAVTTDKTSYRFGDTIGAIARVSSGAAAVANASVAFTFIKPNGATVVKTANSDASGTARVVYKVARKDPAGDWYIHDTATVGGQAATASSAFTVVR
jgi:Gametolysin peptidase M11/NPCBM-associated, NEW3 domain of alpha-galactosidase